MLLETRGGQTQQTQAGEMYKENRLPLIVLSLVSLVSLVSVENKSVRFKIRMFPTFVSDFES